MLLQLRQSHPEVEQAYDLVQQFAQMLRARTGEDLDGQLARAWASQIIVPIPTPGAAAMSRTGAWTPDLTNTAAVAASNATSRRCASARIFRAGFCWADCPVPSSLVVNRFIPSLKQSLDKTDHRSV
jgi:hypothetical protein